MADNKKTPEIKGTIINPEEIKNEGITVTYPDGTTAPLAEAYDTNKDESQLLTDYNKNQENDPEYDRRAEESTIRLYGDPNSLMTEYTVPEPKREDYVPMGYKDNMDYLNSLFPALSKEEEEERVQRYYDNGRWLNYGKAAAALANAIGVQAGGSNQKIEDVRVPDIVSWRAGQQQKRAVRANAAQSINSAYLNAHTAWETQRNAAEIANKKVLERFGGYKANAKKMLLEEQKAKDKAVLDWYREYQKADKATSDEEKRYGLIGTWSRLPIEYRTVHSNGRRTTLEEMAIDVQKYKSVKASEKAEKANKGGSKKESQSSGKTETKSSSRSSRSSHRSSGRSHTSSSTSKQTSSSNNKPNNSIGW